MERKRKRMGRKEIYWMNTSQMERLLDWLINTDIESFSMKNFVKNARSKPECSSQNCIIGNWINHLILNGETDDLILFADNKEYWNEECGNCINYTQTTYKILGVCSTNFKLLFGDMWSNPKLDNSREFAIKRIKYLMDFYKTKGKAAYTMQVYKLYEAVCLYTRYEDKPGFDYKDFFKMNR